MGYRNDDVTWTAESVLESNFWPGQKLKRVLRESCTASGLVNMEMKLQDSSRCNPLCPAKQSKPQCHTPTISVSNRCALGFEQDNMKNQPGSQPRAIGD